MGRIVSGVQPTGSLHIGNYIGALSQWVTLQNDHTCFFPIVDLHALTIPQDPQQLKAWKYETAAAYIACGIDPDRCAIFPQSWVPQHTQLFWLLSCLVPVGWLNRMTQFKEKAQAGLNPATLGLYAYPVLMAADILLYHATHVPVGDDQRQHLELTRDIVGLFHTRFSRSSLFPLPEPVFIEQGVRVMSLKNGMIKMSKSDPSPSSRIHLWDDHDTIAVKVRKAKTDPWPIPDSAQGLEQRPEALNLVTMFAALSRKTTDAICSSYAGQSFSNFKKALTECLIDHLNPLQIRYKELIKDRSHLHGILKKGAQQAESVARIHLAQVQNAMGLSEPF